MPFFFNQTFIKCSQNRQIIAIALSHFHRLYPPLPKQRRNNSHETNSAPSFFSRLKYLSRFLTKVVPIALLFSTTLKPKSQALMAVNETQPPPSTPTSSIKSIPFSFMRLVFTPQFNLPNTSLIILSEASPCPSSQYSL